MYTAIIIFFTACIGNYVQSGNAYGWYGSSVSFNLFIRQPLFFDSLFLHKKLSPDLIPEFYAPEDCLTAAGQLVDLVLPQNKLFMTTSAGRIAYYSKRRTIDLTYLADIEWRDASEAERIDISKKVDAFAFEAIPGNIKNTFKYWTNFGDLANFKTLAVVNMPYNLHGMWVIIGFRDTINLPELYGKKITRYKRDIETKLGIVSLYATDSLMEDSILKLVKSLDTK